MPRQRIPVAHFHQSAPDLDHAPNRPLSEIAFVGRSNVGKSSLINSLLNHRGLAQVSKTPGKTRLLNYFLIGRGLCYFVDLPGYGFARVSEDTRRQWGVAMEEYLRDSAQLALVVLIVDARRGFTPLDEQMADALRIFKRKWIAVLTKSDKLTRQELNAAVRQHEAIWLPQGASTVMPYSAVTHQGRAELWQLIHEVLNPKHRSGELVA